MVSKGSDIKSVWLEPVPNLISDTFKAWSSKAHVEPISIPGYWMDRRGLDALVGASPEFGEKVIYSLHGGAFFFYSASPRDFIAAVPRGLLAHCAPVRRIFATEYRLSVSPRDQHVSPFPAALLDTLAGYVYLTRVVGFAPENIIVVGDSAGANLALALTRYLIEHRGLPGLPEVPGALILLSPWADLTGSDHVPGSSTYTNVGIDYMQSPASPESVRWVKQYFGPLGDEAAFSRYVSPASVDRRTEDASFTGFPRTLVVLGELETFYTQARTLVEKMRRDMGAGRGEGQVDYYEAADSIHDFLAIPLHEPERTQTLRYIANWIA